MAASIMNVTVDIIFGAPPLRSQGFGIVALVRDGVTLGGARYMDFTSPDQLAAALAATTIDNYTYETGIRVLGLRPRAPLFRVMRVKTTAPESETYPDQLAAFLATGAGQETFCYVLDVDTPAIAAASAAVIAAYPKLKLLGATTDEAAPGTAYAACAAFKCFVLDYDKDNIAAYNKGCVGLAARLAYSQDRYSPNFTGGIDGISVSEAAIAQPALEALLAENINVYAERSPEPVYRYKGRQLSGLPTSVYVHSAWLQQRFDETVSALLVSYDRNGITLPVSAIGQDIVIGQLRAVAEQGVELRKLASMAQTVFTAPAITPTDIANQNIPVEVEAQMTTPGASVTVTVRVSQQPVTEEV